MSAINTVVVSRIENRIQAIRVLRIMFDVDLTALYGVETKRLTELVKRIRECFPSDFLFQLNAADKAEVEANSDHIKKLKFSEVLTYAFTEHRAIQAANVLASTQAAEMGIYVVRAFVQLRQASSVHADLDKRLTELALSTERLELSHDTFSRNMRNQLRQVFEAPRELAEKVTPPELPPPKCSIGFLPLENDKPKGSAKAAKALTVGHRKKV